MSQPTDDGLMTRDANPWARDKLDIVECYLQGFSQACQSARSAAVVDGFAGPGMNRFRDDHSLRFGTPLVALHVRPKIPQVLAMDLDAASVEVLATRTAEFGSRAEVRKGDVNRDLVPFIQERVHALAPCLVVLDPEGTELTFETVAAISRARGDKRPELLILLSTHMGFLRLLWNRGLPGYAYGKMDDLYGTRAWFDIYQDRQAGRIGTDEATTRYVQLYADRLRALGYDHVSDREIRERGREGRLGYFLLFAGDHPVGVDIMEHCFNTRFGQELTLFPVDRTTRLQEPG